MKAKQHINIEQILSDLRSILVLVSVEIVKLKVANEECYVISYLFRYLYIININIINR
jgi:hypothetical protein